MSKNIKKALIIIGAVLLVVVLVLYIVFPKQTEYYFNCVKDFINKPLPIVGVSLVIIGHFVYKIILMTKFGDKKLGDLRRKDNEQEEELLKTKEELENTKKELEELKGFIDSVKDKMLEGFSLSSNVKIKSLVKKEDKENE